MGKSKRILLIHHLFLGWERSPAATIFLLKLVNMLKLQGWEIALLTLSGDLLHPDFLLEEKRRAEFLQSIQDMDVRTYTAKGGFSSPKDMILSILKGGKSGFAYAKDSTPSFALSRRKRHKFIKMVRGWIRNRIYSWIFQVWDAYFYCYKQMVREGLKAIREFNPSLLLATYPYPSNLVVGAKLSALSGIPWVMHLQDPLYPLMQTRFFTRKWNTALLVISVYEGLDFPRRKPPLYVLYPGYDPSEYPSAQLLSTFTITGIARGYMSEELTWEFLRALHRLKGEGLLEKFPLKVRFYMLNPFPVLEEGMRKYRLSDIIELHPPVSRREILQRECESALLVLIYSSSKEYVYKIALGGKFWDFLGAGRPILAIGSSSCRQMKMPKELGAGFNCETEEEIYEFLKRALEDFYTKGDIDWNPDRETISQFALPNLAKRLDEILCEVFEREAKGGAKKGR